MSGITNPRIFNLPELTDVENEDEFYRKLRVEAHSKLCKTPFPDSNQESYRKIKFNQFVPGDYFQSSEKGNNTYKIPDGISISPNNLPEEYKKFIQSSFQSSLNKITPNYFTLLSLSYCENPIFLNIQKDTEITASMDTILDGISPSIFQVIFLKLEKNSSLKLIDNIEFKSKREFSLFSGVIFVLQDEYSKLEMILTEDFNDSVWHFRDINFNQMRDTPSKVTYYNLGGHRGKTFINANLMEKGAGIKILGAATPTKREFQDVEITISHLDSHTDSSLLFHTVVKEKAHHVFTGNLIVPRTSSKVGASQVNHNLMLDKSARAESMPKLEVLAEDVRCSHGATMSEVNEEQIFYLQTRGLDISTAKHLIVGGFLSEIIEESGNENFKAMMLQKLLEKLMV